jgi:hypothetical protein
MAKVYWVGDIWGCVVVFFSQTIKWKKAFKKDLVVGIDNSASTKHNLQILLIKKRSCAGSNVTII